MQQSITRLDVPGDDRFQLCSTTSVGGLIISPGTISPGTLVWYVRGFLRLLVLQVGQTVASPVTSVQRYPIRLRQDTVLINVKKLFSLEHRVRQGWKIYLFKLLFFFGFFKSKNLERSIFWFLCFFWILIFRINFVLKPFLYYNFIFNLHELTLPLASTA